MCTCQYRNYRFSLSQQDMIVWLPSVLFLRSLLERVYMYLFLTVQFVRESDTTYLVDQCPRFPQRHSFTRNLPNNGYMIIEAQEHETIVIHSPTKARTKHSQWFVFFFFFSIFFFKHFRPLYPDQPLVKQKNRTSKIPGYWSGMPG